MPDSSNMRRSVILGFPRSGTTLLRRLLNVHSAIHAPGETYLFSASARFIQSRRVADGVDVGPLTGVRSLGFESQAVLDGLRQMVFDLHDRAAAEQGKRHWVEKTAVDAFHIDAIRQIFGKRLKYVVLTRHGLDAVASVQEWCLKAESFPEELHRYIVGEQQPLVAFARAWVDVVRSLDLLAEQLPENVLTIRYEDLVKEPEGVIRRALEFLDEPWEPGLLERGLSAENLGGFGDWKTYGQTRIETGSVDRWRRLSQGTIGDLVPIVNPTLVRHGYEPIPHTDAESQDAALRRYELGLMAQAVTAARKSEPE